MASHYGKFVSIITVLSIISLVLITLEKISHKVFIFSFIPLALGMLVLGILELRKSYKRK